MIISGSLHSAQKLANVLNGFWFTNKVRCVTLCILVRLSSPRVYTNMTMWAIGILERDVQDRDLWP